MTIYMNKFKEIIQRPSVKKTIKILKNKWLIAIVLFLIIVLFAESNNIFSLMRGYRELGAQERQKRYYKEAIKTAEENLQELTSNKDSLEKFAREQYLFHEDDEDVFVIEEK